MPGWSACPMPANRPSSPRSRTPGRRSPTIPSPRCSRSSASCGVDDERVRARRHARPDRRRARGRRPRPRASSAMSSAARVILHLVDGDRRTMSSAPSARSARELAAYGHGLADKPEIVGAQQDRRADAGRGDVEDASAAQARQARREAAVLPLSGVSRRRRAGGAGGAAATIDAGARARRRARSRRARDVSADARCQRPTAAEPLAGGTPAGRQDRLGAAGRRDERRDPPRLARRAGRRRRALPRARPGGADRLVGRDRGRPPPSRPAGSASAARGEAGRRRDRADPPRPCLSGGARRATASPSRRSC